MVGPATAVGATAVGFLSSPCNISDYYSILAPPSLIYMEGGGKKIKKTYSEQQQLLLHQYSCLVCLFWLLFRSLRPLVTITGKTFHNGGGHE